MIIVIGLLVFFLIILVLVMKGAKALKEEQRRGKELTAAEEEVLALSEKFGTIAKIAGVIVGIIAIIFLIVEISSGPERNEWKNLGDDEKQWYRDNYGNGKSESYDNAIRDYQNSH